MCSLLCFDSCNQKQKAPARSGSAALKNTQYRTHIASCSVLLPERFGLRLAPSAPNCLGFSRVSSPSGLDRFQRLPRIVFNCVGYYYTFYLSCQENIAIISRFTVIHNFFTIFCWTIGIFYDIIQSNLRYFKVEFRFSRYFEYVSRTSQSLFDCFPIFFFLLFLHPQQANGTVTPCHSCFYTHWLSFTVIKWFYHLKDRRVLNGG